MDLLLSLLLLAMNGYAAAQWINGQMSPTIDRVC
jgi:hypothetical protein